MMLREAEFDAGFSGVAQIGARRVLDEATKRLVGAVCADSNHPVSACHPLG